ncbi:MAG: T9SS C-terminal target domain-containing protein [Haliscomenobacteraceae bacterium CHB4]|nr:T9SS C-terminal target domain-containing protein [Haliscomenobacteraceae bacterium CHB4]
MAYRVKVNVSKIFIVLLLLSGSRMQAQTISGNVHRNSGQPLPNATVDMTGDVTGTDLTGIPGDYLFENIPAGSDVTLIPSKDVDHTECVSVRDLIFISKHILGLMPLQSPYQLIVADVNKSGSITTFDAVELRKLILGIYTQFPNNTSWRFMDANYIFPNPANPFQSAWPESAGIADIQADVVQDFIGMKTGDVTDCVNDAPAPAFLTLSASNASGMTGQQVSVDVSVQGFNDVLGLQFSMEWDPAVLQLDQVNNLNLANLSLASMNSTSGKLAVCWTHDVASGGLSVPDGTNIFSLQFTIVGTDGGVTPIAFVQTPTKFEVVDGDCLPYGLNVSNGNVQWSGDGNPDLQLIASSATACPGETVCVDISVADFNNIVAGQYSMSWDPSVINFQQVQNFGLPGLTSANFGTSQVSSGLLSFAWFDQNATGVTLPDNSVLFEICFEVIGASGALSPVEFASSPTVLEFINVAGGVVPVQSDNGSVAVIDCQPGDCCTDQQAFEDNVNQGFSFSQHKCGVSVAPNGLGHCQQVTYTWGDGSTSGPFTGNTPASHLYAASGYYSLCAIVEELDTLGQPCFTRDSCWEICVTCDTCSEPAIMLNWSRAGGNSFNIGGNNSNFYISSNASGDFFVTGGFSGAYQGLNSATAGAHDCFVAKYFNDGTLDWEFGFGDAGEEIGTVVKTDAAGNIFVTGIFNSPSFTIPSPGGGTGPIALSNNGDEDIFLAKFDQSRNLQWAFSLGAAWGEHVEDLDIDKDGNIIIVGLFRATVDFDPLFTHTTYTSNNGSNFYAAKYLSSTGQMVWVKTINEDGGAFPLGVSTEPVSGDVYVAGHFSQSVDFDGDVIPEITQSGVGSNAIAPFIVKYSAAGAYQWAIAIQDAPKTSTGIAWDVEADAGSVYVAGDYGNAPGIDFDPIGGDPAFELNGSASFVARYDHSGNAQCVQNAPSNVGVRELSIGPDGRIYLSGNRYNQRMFVGIFDQDCGMIKSMEPHGTPSSCAFSWSVAPDPFGDFAIIGRFTDPDFDADPMAANGTEHNSDGVCVGPGNGITDLFADIFIGKYSCFCLGSTPFCSSCDSVATTAIKDTSASGCCYTLNVHNDKPGYFTYVNIVVQGGGSLMTFPPPAPATGWTLQGYAANSALFQPVGGTIPAGLQSVAGFCLENLTADEQTIVIEYYGPGDTVACRDTLILKCDACVQAIVDSVYCESGTVFKMDFCVKAGESLDWTLGSISIHPPAGITFTPDVFSLPDLTAGQTYCYLTTTVTGGTAGQVICFSSVVHHEDIAAGELDLSCCADTVPVCFTLPACDPCDSTITYATAEQVISPTDSCCWKITLHNPPGYYTGVNTQIVTPGVAFGAVNNFPPISGWQMSSTSSDYIAWTPFGPQGSHVQDGWMLPEICFDGNAPWPWELEITWYTADSTECYDTLEFNCPATGTGGNDDCAIMDSVSIFCNPDGTYSFNFVVTNLATSPPFTADHIHLTPMGPFTVTPSDFYLLLPPFATSPLLTATITGSPTGGVFNFLVSLHDIADDSLHLNCCTTDTIPVPVGDSFGPTCTAPPNVTVDCENFDPGLNYGTATGTDECCFDTIIVSTDYSLLDSFCHRGTVTRTFTALDCAGNATTCQQQISVVYKQDYYVKFPDDLILTNCNGTGDYGTPVFYGEDCELIATSFEDEVFTNTSDACIKIERSWTIINWCTYDPGLPCTVVPNPNPVADVNDPANLPGPVVSESGNSVGGWAPTVAAINPGDSPTDFSTFWSTATNCYQYKQIIKLPDCEAPELSCVQGLVVNIGQTGPPTVIVWATSFVQSAQDNCTPFQFLTFGIRIVGSGTGFPGGQENITFTCNELGIQQVEIWVMDEAGNVNFCVTSVTIQDNSNLCPQAISGDSKAFRLYQNQPNPWSEQTLVPFYTPDAATATLTVYDAMGRVHHTATGEFPKGDNVFALDKKVADADGMLYYRVETPTASATMKMVKEK